MSRPLHPDFAAALSNSTTRPVLFFEAEFSSGTIRLWTGYGSITWDGKIFTGTGDLIGVSPMDEVVGVVASGATVSLSGLNPDLVRVALEESRQGKLGKAWFGLLNDDYTVIANPALLFVGRLDVPSFNVGGDSVVLTISYENRAIDMGRSIGLRYTDEVQKSLYPNDRAFEFVAGLADKTFETGA